MFVLYYFGLKGFLLITLVRTFVVHEPMQRHWLFLSILYTAFLAALSWVFWVNLDPGLRPDVWHVWLAESFVLIAIYFKLLAKFDQGFFFWVIFLAGLVGLFLF